MGKWRAVVLIAVHVVIGLHIAHWLTAGATVTPVEPSEAMAFGRDSVVNAGLIFFAATILLTAVFGRFFCGWGCHLVALQDFCRWLMLKIGITPRPLKSRLLAWVPALAFVYMFLWPAAYRLWHGDSLAVRHVELTTEYFWATFPGWVIGALTFLICGFLCVYFLGAKGFCTYACPYGAIFAAADRVAPLRIRVTDACEQCGHCTAVCSSNVRVHEEVRDWGMVVSPGCMKCRDCISVCPKGALYYGAGPIPWLTARRAEAKARPRSPIVWRDELILGATFACTFLIVRGLYGVVPFLMSLGVAAVMAFLALTTDRILRQPDFDRAGLRLKRGGKLLPSGKIWLAAMGVLLLFWCHSAVVRVQSLRGDRAFSRTQALRLALLAPPDQQPTLPAWASEEVGKGVAAFSVVERWGLFPTLGAAAKLAWLYALAGSSAESDSHARRAIARREMSAEMHQLLARAAARQGDVASADEHWRLAIAAKPEQPEAYLAQGIFMAQRGNLLAAREVFDRGAGIVPDSPQLFYNAGLVRALSGRPEDSIPWFERALSLDARYLEARENLAGVLASLGRFGESVAQYRAALEQSPDDAVTRVLLARALLGLGVRGEAARELEKALELDAANEEARSLLEDLNDDALPQ